MATINDKFTKAADGTGAYPTIANVTQPREAQGDTLTCDDLSGWPTDTAVHFTTFRVLADGKIDASVQSDYKGIVVGNTITQMTRIAGAEDSGHLAGDKVEMNPTVGWVADLVEGLLRSHNQDGTLKNGLILTQVYPVGSIYITAEDKNPQNWLGGTWVAFAKGKTLVGVNPDDTDFKTALKEGGSKTVTLTVDQIPKHHHTIVPKASFSGSRAEGHTTGWEKSNTTSQNTTDTGGGQPHENMPPYITVYFWRRTA